MNTYRTLYLALLVDQRLRGIQIFRLAYFIPGVTSIVAKALVCQWILNAKLGLGNSWLRSLGIEGPSWITDRRAWGVPFAGQLPEREDRFFDIATTTDATGSPLLSGVLGWLDCRVRHAHDGGDHTIFVGDVLA